MPTGGTFSCLFAKVQTIFKPMASWILLTDGGNR